MAASNRDHPNARERAQATERDKDREVLSDPDIRGVRKGRTEGVERASTHRELHSRDRGRG